MIENLFYLESLALTIMYLVASFSHHAGEAVGVATLCAIEHSPRRHRQGDGASRRQGDNAIITQLSCSIYAKHFLQSSF